MKKEEKIRKEITTKYYLSEKEIRDIICTTLEVKNDFNTKVVIRLYMGNDQQLDNCDEIGMEVICKKDEYE